MPVMVREPFSTRGPVPANEQVLQEIVDVLFRPAHMRLWVEDPDRFERMRINWAQRLYTQPVPDRAVLASDAELEPALVGGGEDEPDNWKDFLKAKRAEGKSMKEAGALWRARS